MARPERSRYGHAFSEGKSAVAFRSKTQMRGKPPAPRDLTTVPHPEDRPPARVSPDLVVMRVGEAIEADVRIRISCDNCHHETVWTRGFMEQRLHRQRALTSSAWPP